MRVENASTPRAGPRPDFGADGAPAGRARVEIGSQVPAPAPRPPARVQTGSRLPSAPSPTIYQKDLTTKEEPGRKRGGGESQSLPSPSEEGDVPSSRPLPVSASFWRSPHPLEFAPDATKALTTHTAAQAFTHTSALRSRYTEARGAPPLCLPNGPSDGANRGERGGPAPLPWESRLFPQAAAPTPPTHTPPAPSFLLLPSALPELVSPGSAFQSIRASSPEQPWLPRPRGLQGVREGWSGDLSEPGTYLPRTHTSGLFFAASQP